jgi:hypothetical protein
LSRRLITVPHQARSPRAGTGRRAARRKRRAPGEGSGEESDLESGEEGSLLAAVPGGVNEGWGGPAFGER